jgi:hypothetical protein
VFELIACLDKMQMLPPFPESVWTPSASDLWRLWNQHLNKRPSVTHLSDLEDAEYLLSALCVDRVEKYLP